MTTRRAVLSAFLALPLAAPAVMAQAGGIGAVRVEAGPLLRQSWGARAEAIRSGLERAIQGHLGGLTRGGPTVAVTIRSIQLSSYAGGDDDDGPGGNTDYFESDVRVLSGNRVLSSFPVMSAIAAGSAGPWFLPDIDDRRIAALISNNASWIARYAVR